MLVMFNKKKAGFTLLELLVVIAIIAILAAFLIPALDRVQERAVIAYTETMISNLRLAISMFDTDMGSIPDLNNSTPFPTPPGSLYAQLTVPPVPLGVWAGPYMEFRAEDLNAGIIIDPWGRAYQFRDRDNRPLDFDPDPPIGHTVYIWSLGPDGVSYTDDDIKSW